MSPTELQKVTIEMINREFTRQVLEEFKRTPSYQIFFKDKDKSK